MEIRKIDGEKWVRLIDICDILRYVQDPIVFEDSRKVVAEIARMMFYEDFEAGKAIELPGDFIVASHLNGDFTFYSDTKDGLDLVTKKAEDTKHFEYASEAEAVAERLVVKIKRPFKVYGMGKEGGKITRRFIDELYGCHRKFETEDEQ